jgi:Na+/H+ antiporter NhaD/arsenite permease-like protein
MQETDFDYMTQPKFTKFQKFIINDWIHWLTIVGISKGADYHYIMYIILDSHRLFSYLAIAYEYRRHRSTHELTLLTLLVI